MRLGSHIPIRHSLFAEQCSVKSETPACSGWTPSLIELCEPVFQRILSLQESNEWPSLTCLYTDVQAQLEELQRNARGSTIANLETATLALAAFIDEVVMRSNAVDRKMWPSLQYHLFKTQHAGERFFKNLQVIRDYTYDPTIWNDSSTADLLEIYYLCLLLGYKGKLGNASPEEYQLERDRIHRHIQAKPRGPLSPHLTPSECLNQERSRRKWSRWLWPTKWKRLSPKFNLPWYLIISLSDSEETELLQYSGSLKIHSDLDIDKDLDVFLPDNAVILDNIGGYIICSDEELNGHWLEFLNHLKKFLKGNSLHGVIMTIPAESLKAEIDMQTVQMIHVRLNELRDKLGINPPIYLVCTKCDQLQGFVPFFEDLTVEERDQGWGFTLAGDQQSNPTRAFAEECQLLYRTLSDKRLARLIDMETNAKPAIFRFPIEFKKTCHNLSDFVSHLFRFHTSPNRLMLRGVYFTGVAQREAPQKQQNYFIKGLISKVIGNDQRLGPAGAFGLMPSMT